jgi:hypothetical protein
MADFTGKSDETLGSIINDQINNYELFQDDRVNRQFMV